jgi:hypothetical protein
VNIITKTRYTNAKIMNSEVVADGNFEASFTVTYVIHVKKKHIPQITRWKASKRNSKPKTSV